MASESRTSSQVERLGVSKRSTIVLGRLVRKTF